MPTTVLVVVEAMAVVAVVGVALASRILLLMAAEPEAMAAGVAVVEIQQPVEAVAPGRRVAMITQAVAVVVAGAAVVALQAVVAQEQVFMTDPLLSPGECDAVSGVVSTSVY